MKKLTSLFVILALLMLCACGSKAGTPADGTNAPDSGDIPEVCRVYEDYAVSVIADTSPCGTRVPTPSWPPTAARAGAWTS
mgnify:CR=1 FL=1